MESVKTESFEVCLKKIPKKVRKRVARVFVIWEGNPYHRGLHFEQKYSRERLYSMWASKNYRMLGFKEGDTLYWWWIGQHDEYIKMLNRLK